MATEGDILVQLKTQLVNFLDELIEMFPNEGDFILYRINIKDRISIHEVMNYIVVKILPNQEHIKNKDASFFLQNTTLYEKIDSSTVSYYKKLWLSNKLDNNDREVMWKWVSSFVFLGNKYVDVKKR